MSLNYVGNHGYHEFIYNPLSNGWDTTGTGFGGLPPAPPDPRLRNVQNLFNAAVSNYNGLTVSVSQRAMGGFQYQFNYTWGHAIDEVSNGGINPFSLNDSILGQIDPRNLRRLNYASADYDVRHNFTANYLWKVPFFVHSPYPDAGVTGMIGNSANAITGAGSPFTPLPSYLGGGHPFGCSTPDVPCLTTSNFTASGAEIDYGNQRRNTLRGPGYFNSDFTLRKDGCPAHQPLRRVCRVGCFWPIGSVQRRGEILGC